uniref:Uncharacterized protein n=1 Tax=Romanomermis culicivorax TaxID=13658 RepID=A0A915IIF7_ROMCU
MKPASEGCPRSVYSQVGDSQVSDSQMIDFQLNDSHVSDSRLSEYPIENFRLNRTVAKDIEEFFKYLDEKGIEHPNNRKLVMFMMDSVVLNCDNVLKKLGDKSMPKRPSDEEITQFSNAYGSID